MFVRGERCHVHGDRVPLDERTCGHHLTGSPADRADLRLFQLTTQRPECDVRPHRLHRSQHNRAGARSGRYNAGLGWIARLLLIAALCIVAGLGWIAPPPAHRAARSSSPG